MGEQMLKNPHLYPDKNSRKFFIDHYMNHRKLNPKDKAYEKAGSLGKAYKKLPDDGLILLRNPGLPSPDIYMLEIVVLEKFKANPFEHHKMLLQDKMILNKLKFGQVDNTVYELDSGNIFEMKVKLILPDKRGKTDVLNIISNHEKMLMKKELEKRLKREKNNTGIREDSIEFDLKNELTKMGMLIGEGDTTIGPGGSDNKGPNNKQTDSRLRNKESIRDSDIDTRRASKLPVEMTGSKISRSVLKRRNTLDSKADSNIINKQNVIVNLNNSLDQSKISWKSDSQEEMDQLLDDLYVNVDQVKSHSKVSNTGESSKVYNFGMFDQRKSSVTKFSSRKTSKRKETAFGKLIKNKLIQKELLNEEHTKRLSLLRRSSVALVDKNYDSYMYLLDLVNGFDELSYLKKSKLEIATYNRSKIINSQMSRN